MDISSDDYVEAHEIIRMIMSKSHGESDDTPGPREKTKATRYELSRARAGFGALAVFPIALRCASRRLPGLLSMREAGGRAPLSSEALLLVAENEHEG